MLLTPCPFHLLSHSFLLLQPMEIYSSTQYIATVCGIMLVFMVLEDSYACAEHSITYGVVESLCRTPETNVTAYVICTSTVTTKKTV